MTRLKIDYGIDLGTTNSSIARMENGAPKIIRGNTQKDILPSCVYIDGEHNLILIGDNAFGMFQKDFQQKLINPEHQINTFFEFKRTMGTDKKYYSSNLNKNFTSEELSSEIIKRLKTFVTDENINSVVITVPARFDAIATKATYNAAILAGFEQVELITEPYAASLAYGIANPSNDGYWLVFDFGGGTFDIVLMKMENGRPEQKDSGGDIRLGGKDVDIAIVDEIIIPHLKENFKLDETLSKPFSREIFRNVWKIKTEQAKIALSFSDETTIYTDLFDDFGKDENGNRLECDVKITQDDLKRVSGHLFQRAIDITKDLVKRNNLESSKLTSIILVGGTTYSPILRQILKKQITEKVDTSLDPMCAVSMGAAIFASSVKKNNNKIPIPNDIIAIDFNPPSSTVELDAYLNIWVDELKNKYPIKRSIFAKVERNDKAYTPELKEIKKGKKGLFNVKLNEKTNNEFTIIISDNKGNKINCEPNHFSILQGISIDQKSNLSFHIGVEILDIIREEYVFQPAKGLEKENKLPATGVINGLITQKDIRNGVASDYFIVPIYQGDFGAVGIRAIYNNFITNVKIDGVNFPEFLPKGSEVNLTIKVDRSGQMKFFAEFPIINHTEELVVPLVPHPEVDAKDLLKKIQIAKKDAKKYDLENYIDEFTDLENQLKNEEGSYDGKIRILNSFREKLHPLDIEIKKKEWPILEKQMKSSFYELEELIEKMKENEDIGKFNINKIEAVLEENRNKIEKLITDETEDNKKIAKEVIRNLDFNKLNLLIHLIPDEFIKDFDKQFNQITWKNPNKSISLINSGLSQIQSNYNRERLAKIVFSIYAEMKDHDEFKLGNDKK